MAAPEHAGADNLADKVLIDIANPLDFSAGFPPSLLVKDTDSLGEQVQRAFPKTRVVKSLNTMTAAHRQLQRQDRPLTARSQWATLRT